MAVITQLSFTLLHKQQRGKNLTCSAIVFSTDKAYLCGKCRELFIEALVQNYQADVKVFIIITDRLFI